MTARNHPDFFSSGFSLELLPKFLECSFELVNFRPERGDLFFEFLQAFGIDGSVGALGGNSGGEGFDVDIAGEKMCESRLFLAGEHGQLGDERVVASHEGIESFLHLAEILEIVKPLSPRSQLAQCLRPAEQHKVDHGRLRRFELIDAGQHVFVFGHAARAAVEDVDEIAIAQSFQSVGDGRLVVGDDGVATRFLIAGRDESIEGERVIFRRRQLLFD